MENELILEFISKLAPQFFSQVISKALAQPSTEEQTLNNFLSSLDSLQSLLSLHNIPPTEILKATFSGLSSSFSELSISVTNKKLLKQIEFLINFELLKADPTAVALQKLCKDGRSLSFQMAVAQDSSAFNKFFISQILPRYAKSISSQYLLDFSKSFELFEETENFLNKLKILDKASVQIIENCDKREEIKAEKKELFNIGIPGKVSRQQVKVGRNLDSKTIRKQVNMKSVKKVIYLTPEKNDDEISVEAQKLKAFNQEFFYKRREFDCNDIEIKESEADILVVNTPIRDDEETSEDLWKFKSVFQL